MTPPKTRPSGRDVWHMIRQNAVRPATLRRNGEQTHTCTRSSDAHTHRGALRRRRNVTPDQPL